MPLTGGNLCFVPQGVGYLEHLEPANPGAGNNLNETVPSGWLWLVHTVWLELVADATVLNRAVRFYAYDSAASIIWGTAVVVANQQPQSTRWAYCFATTHGDNETRRTVAGLPYSELVSLPLGGLSLLAGASIQTEIVSLQAGDAVENICLSLQRWRIV